MPAVPYVRQLYTPDLRLADLLIQSGRDSAESERRRGDIAAQLWGNLGQTVAAIPQQIAQQKRLATQDESNALDLAAKRRAASDVSALDTAFQQPTREGVINALPGHLRPQVAKQFADADAAALKVKESKQKIQEANNEYLAGLGHAVATHGYDLGAAGLALQHARDTFEQTGDADMVKQIDGIAQQIQADPNSLRAIVDQVIGLSPKFTELRQTQQHQAATEAQAKTSEEETARHNAAMEAIQKQTGDRAATAATETARHNREMERLRQKQLDAEDTAPSLTNDAQELVAKQFAMTGQLPANIGRGNKATQVVTGIINRAADLYKGLDLASQKAAYEANKGALVQLQKQRDAIGAFEETALRNLNVFLGAAQKIVDTGSPLLNQPLRAIASTGLGSEEQAAFETARRTVIPEFAKILANHGLSVQLSDSARHEIEEVVKGNATMRQIIAAANVLKMDVANRRTSYDDQIKAIQQRIATPPGGAQNEPSPEQWERGPDGKLRRKG